MGYIEKTYGRSEKFLAFKVCFYDGFRLHELDGGAS